MKKPNVLFLFSDQQRWDTVSCYGQPLGAHFCLTPNLDLLAAEGTRFDSAFTCQPVCGPARACIQTGLYPTRVGCHVNDRMLPQNADGIASYFNRAGYETAYVGKWHLASQYTYRPGKDTVDYTVSAVPPHLRGGYKDYWVASDVLEFTSHGYGGYMHDGDMNKREFAHYRADATTDFALEYLEKPKDKPFFLFVSYIEPHHQNDRDCYEGPIGSKERFKDFPVPGDLQGTHGDWREQMPDYLGCCQRLDENVGRIAALLKRTGQYENTVIFYTSDHGTHFRTRNSEYKRSCHDNSTHVPLIARGPGFQGGNKVAALTSLIDIAPTLLTCAGIPVPEAMHGLPMHKLVDQPGSILHNEVFIQVSESCVGRALRTPDWLYFVQAPEGTDAHQPASEVYVEAELYDLKQDPDQRRNLVGEGSLAQVRGTLRETLLSCILREESMAVRILPKADSK